MGLCDQPLQIAASNHLNGLVFSAKALRNWPSTRPLALVGGGFTPVLVHRRADSIHASSLHAANLMPLRWLWPIPRAPQIRFDP
jgi:hypothetical protein